MIQKWIDKPQRRPTDLGLGVASTYLHQWNDAIRCLKGLVGKTEFDCCVHFANMALEFRFYDELLAEFVTSNHNTVSYEIPIFAYIGKGKIEDAATLCLGNYLEYRSTDCFVALDEAFRTNSDLI